MRIWIALVVFVFTFLTDVDRQEINLAVIGIGGALIAVLAILSGTPLVPIALGLTIGISFFALQHLFSRGSWIGSGDIWLGGFLGLLLGWKLLLICLLIAYVAGGIYATFLLLSKRATRKSRVAFGPFLVTAGTICLFFGQFLLERMGF